MKNRTYNVIDLFCGCGGLSLGFEQAGYNVLLGIDIWKDALETFRHNHKNGATLCADLSKITGEDVDREINFQKVDVIIGGPPCQGFSVAGKRIIDDERNSLYKSFVRMVEYFKPKAFVLENVPNILSIGGGTVRETIICDFQRLGYNVVTQVLTASDYGVPQNRRRAIFVGLKEFSFDFDIPKVVHKVTTAEALSDLPEGSQSYKSDYICDSQSDYQTFMRQNSKGVMNHEVTMHNAQTTEIIAMVPDGGNYKDLPLYLQNTRKVHIAWTRLNSQKPSITIDTGHRHHFHYKWNRVPTVRESARIQSFPDDFEFLCSRTSQYKQVGNAVPPLMAKAIAEQLKKNLLCQKKQ
ncbi:MAG: DNA cytosine methyltransferase [Bacteroidaceae bacterium]|nr:DNA cytosine methyltransferase [Bacteroidaceae bacterium]